MGEAPCFAHLLDEHGNMPQGPNILIRRVYDDDANRTGEIRVLVDRVWPRGVARERLPIDLWAKDLAPSTELRRWFGHDPGKWTAFQSRYRQELAEKQPLLREVAALAREGSLVLLYGARDRKHNQAVVLKDVLEQGI